MPLPSVTFRSELDPIVRKELDQLDSELTEYLLTEHDDDGNHAHITAQSITVTGPTDLTSPVTIDGMPVSAAKPSASTFFYRADVNFQTASDPGSGRLRWNTVNQHLATALYVDRLTDDGFDAMLFLELSHIADRFVLQDANLAVNYQVWRLTGTAIDHVDWFELPVVFESSNGAGTFGQLDRIAMLVQTGGGSGGVTAHHATHETGGTDAIVALSGGVITTGTVADARLSANIARRNEANTFASWIDVVDFIRARSWIYELARTVPMGHWQAVPYSASNFAAVSPMTWTVSSAEIYTNSYSVVGKTLFWHFFLNTSTLGGTAAGTLLIKPPLPPAYKHQPQRIARATFGGAFLDLVMTIYDPTTMQIAPLTYANFPLGSCGLQFQAVLEIA